MGTTTRNAVQRTEKADSDQEHGTSCSLPQGIFRAARRDKLPESRKGDPK